MGGAGTTSGGVVRAAVALSLTGFVVLAVSNDAAAPRLTAPDLFFAGFVRGGLAELGRATYGSRLRYSELAAVLPAVSTWPVAGSEDSRVTRLATVILLDRNGGSR